MPNQSSLLHQIADKARADEYSISVGHRLNKDSIDRSLLLAVAVLAEEVAALKERS